MLRVLLIADTHLGFDLPSRPRVEKRRRGPDFFANTRRALEPAREGRVDLVVHGGDLLYRSKVPASLVQSALDPLLEVADNGTPVILVPGNHERSALPYPLLAAHKNLFMFDVPRSIRLRLADADVLVAGFPCEREPAGSRFRELVRQTDATRTRSDIKLLCFHQAVQGATVGPSSFTFRYGRDVVRAQDLPVGFAAVLAGHIHRRQVLSHDLAGRDLPCPVFYPGSVERTSFAERDEPKGYLEIEISPDPNSGGRVESWKFNELPTRPMEMLKLAVDGLEPTELERRIASHIGRLNHDAVVQLRFEGQLAPGAEDVLRAAHLRSLHPPTMNVEIAGWRGGRDRKP